MNLQSARAEAASSQSPPEATFWRVEGSLVRFSAVRQVAFFTWNAQTFTERWARRGGLALLFLFRPFLYAAHRRFATRVLHMLLRGVSQDRLDLLGEEYFQYLIKPRLRRQGIERLRALLAEGKPVVLVSHSLDHIVRPLAQYLEVSHILCNRLEFRDGLATGRLADPVVRPRGGFALLTQRDPDGSLDWPQLLKRLDFEKAPELAQRGIVPAVRRRLAPSRPPVVFDRARSVDRLSVRASLRGKHVLLIGATGFIGKVWLASLLEDLPDVGRVYLLIRRQGSKTAVQRFERIVAESPVFDRLHELHGDRLAEFLRARVKVLDGDVTRPGFGLDEATLIFLRRDLDLIINSSGLTDFNPDLRDALSVNVDSTVHLLDFQRSTQRAALLHLSTCFVAGFRDGRFAEELTPDYCPAGVSGFNAEEEWQRMHELMRQTEQRAESPEVTEELRRQALSKSTAAKDLQGAALDIQIRKNRLRWLRAELTAAGTRRAKQLGWPNTYTFTKSLAESIIQRRAPDLPIAIVRPSIVETSTRKPFCGWNEGINTSAGLSYLLGTFFRQLPSNEKKRLDVVPVDLVCAGMTLISAALVERRHQRLYHLATSARNPCDMRRSIELTGLAHRKFYRAQEGFEHWLRSRMDPIPVSKSRYQAFSAPAQKAAVRMLRQLAAPLPNGAQAPLLRAERGLARVQKLIELYEPFILHNEHVFEAEHVEILAAALPEEERATFGYDPCAIDWWEYWINIHIPALRKWSYPLIEGRSLEYRSRPFQLDPENRGASPDTSVPAGATWPSS